MLIQAVTLFPEMFRSIVEYGEKLIPFVSHYIDGVDAETRKITADWGVDY